MQSKGTDTMPVNNGQVWVEASSAPIAAVPSSKAGNYMLISVILLVVAFVATTWCYFSGFYLFRSSFGSAQNHSVGGEILSSAKIWALQTALAGMSGSLLLVATSALFLRRIKEYFAKQELVLKHALETRSQRLVGEMTDAKITVEEKENELLVAQKRMTEISARCFSLEKELERRDAAEKSLSKQAMQMEKSKDMLQMHVKARTEQIEKLQRRHELILNSAADGICSFDLQGKAIFANPSSIRVTGWTAEEIIGKTEDEIFFTIKNPESKDKITTLRDADGKPLPEQILMCKGGTSFPAEYFRTRILENNRVVGNVVMFRDITERRSSENKLQLKASELARSNNELEQFAFVASHDLQEPLRKIQAFGDRLKMKCADALEAEGKDYLERMQNAAARMQTLINDLLTFSLVISSSQPFVALDLGTVVREVLGDLEHRIEKTAAKVEVAELPKIEADATQMQQLFQNLIGNALKFKTAETAPVVRISSRLVRRLEIDNYLSDIKPGTSSNPDDLFCIIEIADNGIGFDEQYLEKIFAVFQRLHGREAYEGTGVGLAVCRRITERHGGAITARSKPGQGATFTVVLPVEQREPSKAP